MGAIEENEKQKEYIKQYDNLKTVIKQMNGLSDEGFKNRIINDPYFHNGFNMLLSLIYAEDGIKKKSGRYPWIGVDLAGGPDFSIYPTGNMPRGLRSNSGVIDDACNFDPVNYCQADVEITQKMFETLNNKKLNSKEE